MLVTNELPILSVEPGIRKGRNPSDGYARGWGLEFGDLQGRLRLDPAYEHALALASGRTIQAECRRMNLYLLIKHYLRRIPRGNVLELGSYKGGSAIFMASALKTFLPDARCVALDTFEGMPYTDSAIDAHGKGDFADVDLGELCRFADQSGLSNLRFVKGRFEDTLPKLLPQLAPLALVHIDCDVREAVAYSYDAVKDSMVPGGYIAFDDATTSSCIGATEVVEELVIGRDGRYSEQIFPHYVFRIGLT